MKSLWVKKTVAGAILTTIALGGANCVWAAEAEKAPEQDIVITANRLKNTKADTPADVTVITAEDIETKGYRTVTDALEAVPGARVIRNGVRAYESHISLNGDQRVLVMVDGRRFNQSMGSMARATFDANTLPPVSMIERIEVIKGGSSTLYGSDAVGGVINIITKTPEETTGKVRVGYGSWGTQDLSAVVGGKVDKTGIQIAAGRNKASYTKYKDMNGDTKKWPGQSDYRQDAVSLKLTQDFTDTDGLTFNYDYSILNGNTPYSVNPYSYFPSHINKKTNNVGLKYDWNRNADNSGYVQAYRNYYSYFNQGDMNETDWVLEGQQNFVLSDTNTLVGGLEYRHAKAENAQSYNGSKGYNNKAIFLQDQWKFAPTWQLNTGVRYDDHSKSGNRTTGSAAINKKFSKDSNAYLAWNQVFRTPTIDDLYYFQDLSMWGYGKYVGNENLKPETGNVWNLGYNFKATPKTDVSVNAFYSRLHNAINWNYVGWDSYAENVDKEKKRGLTLSVNHEIDKHWDVNAAYTYVKVETNNNNTSYARDLNYAPNYYQFGVRFHDNVWNVSLTGRAANGLSRERYGENRYLTMDLNARYKFSKNWTGFASIYNLNNAAYAEQASHAYGGGTIAQDYYPMPGRRYIIGAEYSF